MELSVNQVQSDFLKMAVPLAQATQKSWGVPASVTIAQAILESSSAQGWGKSSLARLANNYFGIKATQVANPESYIERDTTEIVDGRSVRVHAKFARYATPAASFEAHAKLLATAKRYRPAMAVRANVVEFAAQLEACGYSTSPNYNETLTALIEKYDLTQYDLPPEDPAVAKEIAA